MNKPKNMIGAIYLALIVLTITCFKGNQEALAASIAIPITVKEAAGVGANEYPVQMVFPVPYGQYDNIDNFRIEDSAGNPIPAQFETMNRWWARDNSIRHILVNFQPTVNAYTTAGTGESTYYLKDTEAYNFTSNLNVMEETNSVTINTGKIKFIINKNSNFNIFDQLWKDLNGDGDYDDAGEEIISSNSRNGGNLKPRAENQGGTVQYDSSRNDITVEIEESGPLRAVIRVEGLTKYDSSTNHTHGFAVRIYAYKDKDFVKVDYQLQNSAMRGHDGDYRVFAWPLYFEEMNMDFSLNMEGDPTVRIGRTDGTIYQNNRGSGKYIAQEYHNDVNIYDGTFDAGNQIRVYNGNIVQGETHTGFIDISDGQKGVLATTRHFWQKWPNGLEIDGNNKLSVQLFPEWSQQYHHGGGGIDEFKTPIQANSTGLYWLEDMQHIYKESLLYFHDNSTLGSKLKQISETFDHPPVATIPEDWYRKTNVTLDLGGYIPQVTFTRGDESRLPIYHDSFYEETNSSYSFNWDFFIIDQSRKHFPGDYGDWPHSASAFIATQNPADYYFLEEFASGYINIHPEWMSGYDYEDDQANMQLTKNPYAGYSWRDFNGSGHPWLDPVEWDNHADNTTTRGYLTGTASDAKAHDDEHLWTVQMEEGYFLTGNMWIKDWFRFISEMQKIHMSATKSHPWTDPFLDASPRARGHNLLLASQAYRVTGDPDLLAKMADFVSNYIDSKRKEYGAFGNRWSKADEHNGSECDYNYQLAFLAHGIIGYMDELDPKSTEYAQAFQIISGFIEWNYNIDNYFYYSFTTYNYRQTKSSYQSSPFADIQSWYFLQTGRQELYEQTKLFVEQGIFEDPANDPEPAWGPQAFSAMSMDNPWGDSYTDDYPNMWYSRDPDIISPGIYSFNKNYLGRIYQYSNYLIENGLKTDIIPPNQIHDLSANISNGNLTLNWTAPSDTDLEKYHIVYATENIKPDYAVSHSDGINWFMADTYADTSLIPSSGNRESVTLAIPEDKPYYAAIFTFDKNGNISRSSNVAVTDNEELTTSVVGSGNGTVSSVDGGIFCGQDCEERYNNGTVVQLEANANLGSYFIGWAGDCTGSGNCQVTMDQAMNVIAQFDANPASSVLVDFQATEENNIYGLASKGWTDFIHDGYTVNTNIGPGGLATNLYSGGIAAFGGVKTTDQSHQFNIGDIVSVTWYNNTNSDLSITPYISFDDPDARNSGSTGTWQQMTSTTIPANGLGTTIYSLPSNASYDLININPNYLGNLKLILDGIELLSNVNLYNLEVNKTGSGTITSSPAGIQCGSTCSSSFIEGTTVTLTATSETGSIFTGWSGGECSGTGECVVDMTSDITVTAKYIGTELGDVNKDKTVNIQDVIACTNAILNGKNEADVNGDGETNIQDIVLIINVIMAN